MPVPEAEPLLVLGAWHSTPVRRYLSAERVPDDVVSAILDAAVRGPSGGNQQSWGRVVVTDPGSSSRWPGGTGRAGPGRTAIGGSRSWLLRRRQVPG